MADPGKWSCNQVSEWLKDNGFQKYCTLLCDEHQIDGQSLLSLTENDLKQPPIEIHVIGDVKRLTHLIKCLKSKQYSYQNGRKNGTVSHNGVIPVPSETILQLVENATSETLLPECNGFANKQCNNQQIRNIDPEKRKTLIGVIYLLFGFFCTCYSIVIVQAKAPDQKIHPPLPDLFLNHFPQISWAYKVSDGVLISLMLTWIIIVILHKHR